MNRVPSDPAALQSGGEAAAMTSLARLREFFFDQHILICFNGPTTQSLIGEIGKALKQHIAATEGEQSNAMDVFSVYIEMSQNIRHYCALRAYDERLASATVVIASLPSNHYSLSAVNLVETADGQALLARVRDLAGLGKDDLKGLYKAQLRQPQRREGGGAGLGLIEMARRSSQPMQASLDQAAEGRSYFSLRVTV